MENTKVFNMCLGEAYCLDCGKKEYFNSNDPFTTPLECKNCGGEMTTYQKEKIMKMFRQDLPEIIKHQKEIRKKNRSEEDQFMINILESLKNKFNTEDMYSGFYIKQLINNMIKRME